MNILCVIEKNSWLEFHIVAAFIAMGHHVTTYYFGDYISEYYGFSRRGVRKERNSELLTIAKTLQLEGKLDFIFCYVYDDFLLEQYAKALNKLDVPIVNYNVDMPTQWYRQIKTAKYFTKILCAQPTHIEALFKYGKNTFFFPMASMPFLEVEQVSFSNQETQVTFLGTPTVFRKQVLALLIDRQLPINIYGKYWKEKKIADDTRNFEKTCWDCLNYGVPRLKAEGIKSLLDSLHRKLSRDKEHQTTIIPNHVLHGAIESKYIPVLFYQSKINIGMTRYANFNYTKRGKCQMKLRDFEVPMAGGFYLVEKAPGYDQCFVDGKEVVMWSTVDELQDKIKYYLIQDKQRKQIALAGQKRAIQDHSWQARFIHLFAELGLPTNV